MRPCAYMMEEAGDVHDTPFDEIWANAEVFKKLRTKAYSGACGKCKFNDRCGGCRARAAYYEGDTRPLRKINRRWTESMAKPAMDYDENAYSVQCDINDAVTLATGAVTMTYEAAGLKVEEFDDKLEAAYKLKKIIDTKRHS